MFGRARDGRSLVRLTAGRWMASSAVTVQRYMLVRWLTLAVTLVAVPWLVIVVALGLPNTARGVAA